MPEALTFVIFLALKGLKPFLGFLFLVGFFFQRWPSRCQAFAGGGDTRESKKLSGADDAMRRELNFCFLIHSHMSSEVCG